MCREFPADMAVAAVVAEEEVAVVVAVEAAAEVRHCRHCRCRHGDGHRHTVYKLRGG